MRDPFVTGALLLATLSAVLAPRIAAADDVTLPAAGTSPALTGYLARPAVLPAPAVLVLPSCVGLGKMERAAVDDLAAHGFVGLAIDTNTPQGSASTCAFVAKAVAVADGYAISALSWLAAQPYVKSDQLGLLGFSQGGIVALDLDDPWTECGPMTPYAPGQRQTAVQRCPPVRRPLPRGVRAVVAYYPTCAQRTPNVYVPLQILDGDADDWIPFAPCQALAQSATAAGKTVQITTYPGVTHYFNEPATAPRTYLGHTLRYDPAAAADAEAKTMAFFAQLLR
jgi:dienelactone hydrolase